MARKQVEKDEATNCPSVDIVHPSYQPTAAELREDLRIDATFEQLTDALAKDVKVNYVKSPKNVRR